MVLMDVQMPEMDGLRSDPASSAASEVEPGGHIPIVAMTAHAMQGDRERCLAAGMDDYVSKPIDAERLMQAIERCHGSLAPPTTTSDATLQLDAPALHGVIDVEAASRRVGGTEMLIELAEILLEECPMLMRNIRDAITERDADVLQRASHTLKGSSRVFEAEQVAAAAQRLEDMGRNRELDDTQPALEALNHEVQRMMSALTALLNAP